MEKEWIANNNTSILSSSIASIRFPLVISILLLHSYTIQVLPGHPYYIRILYPFALWIGETGVPAYFFISGLLFFYSNKTYTQKIKTRISTLLIPYFIWNGIILIGYIIVYLLGHDSLINNSKYISDYNSYDYLYAFWDRGDWGNGNGKPILPPMWYIRNLFLLCIMSPVIKIVIEKTHIVIPIILALLWICHQGDVYILQSLTMFSLGATFPILKIDLIAFILRYKKYLVTIYLIITICDLSTHMFWNLQNSYIIHRLGLIFNIFSAIGLGIFLVSKNLSFKRYSHMSFFIFCIHLPIITILRKPILNHTEWSTFVHILLYFVAIIICVCICISIYKIIYRLFPTFINLSTGNRNKTS